MLVTDYCYYGRWVFVPYTFIHANLVRGVSVFYGHHPWHWYVSQGLLVVLTTFLPLTGYGIWCAKSTRRTAAYASLWLLCIYSLLAHKEFRFIYPIVPIALVYAAYGANRLWHKPSLQSSQWMRIAFLAVLIIPNLIMAPLFASFHQRGVIDAVDWLRHQSDVQSIGYLMPCHSTPFWSRLHRRIPMWFLTCEPPAS
jgi:phosphatidylinositol glycan class B